MEFKKLITSESVGPGHPDKICDQISDLVLDECLKTDSNSRVACEVFASNHLIVIGGEITTKAYVDVVQCAWKILKPLGYDENDFTVLCNINCQSPDIAQKVNLKNNILGSGDQGMVYGYACNETPSYMPLTITLAHELIMATTKAIKNKKLIGAKYDMKSQVTIDYTDSKKLKIDTIIMSIQHDEKINLEKFKKQVKELIVMPLVKKYRLNNDFDCFINNGGTFIIGGPIGDTGLTGRKIIVDTYGSIGRHGGGSFSGKDYTKVDRTGAYFARKIAKTIVAAKLADQCEIQLSYCIGKTAPISMFIDCFGTNKTDIKKIYAAVKKTFNFELADVVKSLDLRKPIYSKLAVFGQIGRTDIDLSWEKLDMIKVLLNNLEK